MPDPGEEGMQWSPLNRARLHPRRQAMHPGGPHDARESCRSRPFGHLLGHLVSGGSALRAYRRGCSFVAFLVRRESERDLLRSGPRHEGLPLPPQSLPVRRRCLHEPAAQGFQRPSRGQLGGME